MVRSQEETDVAQRTEKLRVTVSSKGQISLPVALRRSLGIRQGDQLALEPQDDGSIVLRREETDDIERLIGAWSDLLDEYGSVDQMIAELRRPAGE
jgi:AbrB family looped-hinge helix DNA binding protein